MNVKIILFILMVSTTCAHAGFYTGNDLLRLYNSTNSSQKEKVKGYVAGISDSYNKTICLKKGMVLSQITAVAIQYIEKNPKKRHYSARTLVLSALKSAFPCNKR